MLLCVGSFTIILTALFVNITIRLQFKEYVESNIENTSTLIVKSLERFYAEQGNWNETIDEQLFTETQVGNFSIAILNTNKELM